MANILHFDDFLKENIELSIAMACQIVILYYLNQILICYIVYLLAYLANQQFANFQLDVLCLQL